MNSRSEKLSALSAQRRKLGLELKLVSMLYRRAWGQPSKRIALGLEWDAILRELRSIEAERQATVCRPPKGRREWATFGSLGISR